MRQFPDAVTVTRTDRKLTVILTLQISEAEFHVPGCDEDLRKPERINRVGQHCRSMFLEQKSEVLANSLLHSSIASVPQSGHLFGILREHSTDPRGRQ